MTLIEVLLLLLIAGIAGALGKAIAGFYPGGFLVSIVLGFIGALLGVWIGAATRFPPTALGAMVGSAAVLAQPLFVPGAVRALPGFTLATGCWLLLGTVFVTLCVAAVAARSARGIVLRPSWPAEDSAPPRDRQDEQGSGARVESKGG